MLFAIRFTILSVVMITHSYVNASIAPSEKWVLILSRGLEIVTPHKRMVNHKWVMPNTCILINWFLGVMYLVQRRRPDAGVPSQPRFHENCRWVTQLMIWPSDILKERVLIIVSLHFCRVFVELGAEPKRMTTTQPICRLCLKSLKKLEIQLMPLLKSSKYPTAVAARHMLFRVQCKGVGFGAEASLFTNW